MHLLGTHFGTYEVCEGTAGEPRLRPFRHDPAPSPVGAAYLDLARHPARVLGPMARQGWLEAPDRAPQDRGRDAFVRLDWETAARLAAEELARVRDRHGNEAIFAGSYGWASAGRFHHAQSQLKRFLNLAGGFVSSVNTYSYGAAAVLLPHVLGPEFAGATDTAPGWDEIAANARLLIAFGGLRLSNAQVEAGGTGAHRAEAGLDRALAAGLRLVVVSPVAADAPARPGVEHLALRPGSDTAILLAMAHTLMAEGLADRAFLARCTVGFARFAAYLAGDPDGTAKDADWASALSRVPAETIRGLARAYAGQPALLNLAWSLQRARFGEQSYWAAIALAAMAGRVGRPGCGFSFGLASVNSAGRPGRRLRGPALPQGQNPVERFIPVARITELLSRPGDRIAYDGQEIVLPDIRLVWWAGGNPFHHHQDLGRLAEAWRRPETVIVHESVWTATARHADLVLPASLPFERDDIAASSRDDWIVASRTVLPPPPGVRSDHSALAAIAGRLGLAEAFTEGRSEAEWLARLYEGYRRNHPELPGFEAFWRAGHARLDPGEDPDRPTARLARFVAEPGRHPLSTPSGRIELASDAIAGFGLRDCPGHPAWIAPEEWLGAPLAARHPFHLLSPQPEARLHSQLEPAGPSQATKIGGREPVLMAPETARRHGLARGDAVELWNDRGRCLAAALPAPGLPPDVLVLATGAWFDPVPAPDGGWIDRSGNPNALTSDRPASSLSQGPAPNSCLVSLRPWRGGAGARYPA